MTAPRAMRRMRVSGSGSRGRGGWSVSGPRESRSASSSATRACATTCPPPRHDFTEPPRIRSERPAFELHYPHLVERYRKEAHVGRRSSPYEVAAQVAGREEQPDADPRSR
jgi:hypothetical protein